MEVSGGEAAGYNVVRLDNYATVNDGRLVSADEDTGAVSWLDKTAETKSVTLGAHAIKIIPRGHGR